jgi:hypothetical protein
MVRLGLALYLMLSIAAGPWFCCCTASRFLAFATSVERAKHPGGHRCCCHHRQGTGNGTAKQEQGKPSPSPPSPCPCEKNQRQLSTFTVPGHPEGAGRDRPTPVPSSFGTGASVSASTSPTSLAHGLTPRECIAFPFLGGQDILRALHIQRC